MEEKDSKLPLVSVIIPVYNVQDYLKKCLESIINQTYDNLEIIIIDDGSIDDSGKICDEYKKDDKRIKVIHKENGGLSDARNCGIEMATGEYLTFVDSDDYLDLDYVQYLYNLIQKNKCKLSICSLHFYYTGNGKVKHSGNGEIGVLSGKECIEKMCYHDEVDTCAYAKLYHKSLFESVRFPRGKLFEDIGTSYLLFDQCDKVAYGFEPKYYYVIRSNSIVTSKFNNKKLDLIEMTDRMANYVNNKYPDLNQATLRRCAYARFSTLNQMIGVANIDNLRDEMITYLRNVSSQILRNPKTPKRDRVAFVLLKIGYPCYCILWRIYFKVKRG
ncbi:MAG: glycosyltransferase [Lachnospiraceae bacterium]